MSGHWLSWMDRGSASSQGESHAGRSGPDVWTILREFERGVPAAWVRGLAAEGLTREDIRTIIPDRTLERRIAEGRPLTLDEVDAVIRLLRVVAAARRVFEDVAKADRWLRRPNPALEGAVPIRLARTDLGGREVEAVLGRLEYGVHG